MEIQQAHVKIMWNTKLKSRYSFLTILEFIHVGRYAFKWLLPLIQGKVGRNFYE